MRRCLAVGRSAGRSPNRRRSSWQTLDPLRSRRRGRYRWDHVGRTPSRRAQPGAARGRAAWPARGRAAPPGPPLLIIAGAGSGKTATLAHRVAHLVLKGADPGRLLLLTFTRRAAEAMVRRAERICSQALGNRRRLRRPAGMGRHLPRHRRAPVAPLCRRDRPRSRLHHPGPRRRRRPHRPRPRRARAEPDRPPLPPEGHLPRHLLLRGQCPGTARPGAAGLLPLVCRMGGRAEALFGAYVDAKQRQGVLDYDDLLLWWEQMVAVPEVAADLGRRFDFVLVDEYQDTNAIQAAILQRIKPDGRGRHRGRRRCPGDLRLPGRHGAQHPGLPAPLHAAGARSWHSSRTTARPSRSWPPPTP